MYRRPLAAAARPRRQATKIHHLLERALTDHPWQTAVIEGCHRWSYTRLAEESARIATWLAGIGVRSGDRILTVLPGSAHLVALLYACSSRGAIFVPVPPDVTSYQLEAFIADLKPSVIIVARPELVDGVRAGALVTDLGTLVSSLPAVSGCAVPGPSAERDDQRLALLLYTSGSAALPKAVISPHRQVLFATRAIGERLRYRHSDVVYSRVPMSFDYGLYQALLCAQAGCTLVVDESAPALGMMAAMNQVGATVVPLLPPLATILGSLAARISARPPVRLFTNTGAPLSAATTSMLRTSFPAARVSLMYGLTECKRATIMPPDGDLTRPGSVGIPLRGTRIRIRAGDELTQAPEVTGEIVVQGPHVMTGYWRAPELTAQKFLTAADGQSSLMTGDVGYFDAEGYLYLTGRLDETFKRRGVRMSCQEIEAAALGIPGVTEAAVLPPAPAHDLTIVVVSQLPPASVLRSLAERLPPEKRPVHCHVFPRLPVTSRGKIDRDLLRSKVVTGYDTQNDGTPPASPSRPD